MKVLLSEQCLSLVGTLERGLGYHLQRRKNGFFAKRDSKGYVPPDGHWRFIVLCAETARHKLAITDIQVSWEELYNALYEAHRFVAAEHVRTKAHKLWYNARDVLNLKTLFSL